MIRQATSDDLAAILAIDQEAFASYGTTEDHDVFAARLEAFPAGCLVATRDGTVIGYATAETWHTEREPALNEDPRQTHQPGGQVWCITAMAVTRAMQNQGVGTTLLNEQMVLARQYRARRILLETTHAQPFYAHRGFSLWQTREQGGVILSVMTYVL